MKKSLLLVAVLGLALVVDAGAQGFTLIWSETSAPSENFDGTPLPNDVLAQLIFTSSGSVPALLFTTVNGLPASGFTIIDNTVSTGNPTTTFVDSLESAQNFVGDGDSIFARIFNKTSSGGVGSTDIPTPAFDAGQGAVGLWYADMPVQTLSDPSIAVSYNFQVDQGDWQFAVVPEPTTVMLFLGGALLLGIRYVRRRA